MNNYALPKLQILSLANLTNISPSGLIDALLRVFNDEESKTIGSRMGGTKGL